ncbi:Uncharacterised protein [Burkholderia pseudomallei]|nr:Uncharacterised protein [Burkholderia pseudomallei]
MTQKVTVQALRDIALHPPLNEGDRRDFTTREARTLVAMRLVRIVNKPGRPKATGRAPA